jgi:hypothetical protein
MSVYIFIFTVAIRLNYTIEFRELFEASTFAVIAHVNGVDIAQAV